MSERGIFFMLEQMKNEILLKLEGMDTTTLQAVARAFDVVAEKYTISKKETGLSVITGDLPEAAKVYLVTRKIEGLSSGTLDLYKMNLEMFFSACRKPLQEITANDIRIYLYRYQEERGVSNRTLDGVRTSTCTFFRWAAAEGYVQADPSITVKKIKYEKRHRDALSQLELEMLRNACETIREKAILEFLYSTGCRVSEAVGVNLSDIDWASGELEVLGKGNKHRKVYLNAKAQVALKEYILARADNNDVLFVSDRAPYGRIQKQAMERAITKIAGRSGVKKNVTPHILRHTYATVMAQGGTPIQDVSAALGHSSVNTTMIYAEISENQVKAGHARCVI